MLVQQFNLGAAVNIQMPNLRKRFSDLDREAPIPVPLGPTLAPNRTIVQSAEGSHAAAVGKQAHVSLQTVRQSKPLHLGLVAELTRHRPQFLAFLSRRIGAAEADDVLQACLTRALERGATLRDPQRVVAWFYRMLRSELADRRRRRGVEERVDAELTWSSSTSAEHDPEVRPCTCVFQVLPTLAESHAQILREVDLAEVPVTHAAKALRITANNASVRLHRARRALRARLQETCGRCAERSCLDCTCPAPA